MAEPKNRKREPLPNASTGLAQERLQERKKRRYLYVIFRQWSPAKGIELDPLEDEAWDLTHGNPSPAYPVSVICFRSSKGAALEYLASIPPGRRSQYSYGPILIDERVKARFRSESASLREVVEEALR